MTEPNPLASVIIPNWNGLAHLPTCLEALRAQTYPRLEVIVVDNGSSGRLAGFVTSVSIQRCAWSGSRPEPGPDRRHQSRHPR